jgi:hypothetical protein
VPQAEHYIIEVAADTTFANLVLVDSSLASEDYSYTFADGEYYWRVTAYNSMYYSPRSEVNPFTVVTFMATPAILSPADGSAVDSSRVFFDWDDIPYAYRYILEVSVDPTFGSYALLDSNIYMTSEYLSAPLANGLYNCRLTATNDLVYSNRSLINEFIVDYFGIPAPTLLTPIEGFISRDAFITYDWTDVDDTITYQLEISKSVDFDSIVFSRSVSISIYPSTDSLPNDEYFWRVRATDGVHFTPYSEIQTFFVDVDGTFLPGDANNSGSVNGIDVVYLVAYLKGGPMPIPLLAGDANGTCTVNGLDVTYLVNFFKGWGAYPIAGDCITAINPGGSPAE